MDGHLESSEPSETSNCPVIYNNKLIGMISVREKKFLDAYVNCGNVAEAAFSVGLELELANIFIKNDRFKAYIQHRLMRAANKADYTLDALFYDVVMTAKGILKVDMIRLKAMQLVADMLGIRRAALSQTNLAIINGISSGNGNGKSVAHMSAEELDAELSKRGFKTISAGPLGEDQATGNSGQTVPS